jgi:hypothetical protein
MVVVAWSINTRVFLKLKKKFKKEPWQDSWSNKETPNLSKNGSSLELNRTSIELKPSNSIPDPLSLSSNSSEVDLPV